MTVVPQKGLGDSNLPMAVSRAATRSALERNALAAMAEHIKNAIARLPSTAGMNETVKETLLSNSLAAIEKLPYPYDAGANFQSAMSRLLVQTLESDVLIKLDGRAYGLGPSSQGGLVEILQAVYQAASTTMAAIRSELGPEASHPFLDEMESLLQTSRIATDAVRAMTEHGETKQVSHQKERDALLGVLAFDCGVLIEGLQNVVARELPQWIDVLQLGGQVEALAAKVQIDRGHADLGELALDRTPSLSERIMDLDDKLRDIAEELAVELHDAEPPLDINEVMSLQQDLHRIFGELHGDGGSSAEHALQQAAVAKLRAYLDTLTSWEARRSNNESPQA